MTEKAYKTMAKAGACNLIIGILLVVVGLVSGLLAIINGARLLKSKSDLIF